MTKPKRIEVAAMANMTRREVRVTNRGANTLLSDCSTIEIEIHS